MKKNILTAFISATVLVAIAAGLYFWAFYPKELRTEERTDADYVADKEDNVGGQASGNVEDGAGSGASGNVEDGAGSGASGNVEDGAGSGASGNVENGAGSGTAANIENGAGSAAGNGGNDAPEAVLEDTEVTLVFSGDIYLSPYVQQNYDSGGITGVVSDGLLGEMKNADIAMANLEFPFSTGGEAAADKQFTFRVDPSYASVLTDMGIDVVTAANNHALDYGKQALTDTFDTLDGSGIAYVGAGADKERAMQPYLIKKGAKTFGFLGASRVIPEVGWNIENGQPGMLCTYDGALLCEAIGKAKEQCDFLSVYVHWGIERENTPKEYQRQLAKEYIDAGADLVIGAHPHVLQGIEYYNGKPVVYSLGNYIFNQQIEHTILLKVTVPQEGEATLRLLPAYAEGAVTKERSEDKASELYQFMENISFGIRIMEDGMVSKSLEE